MSFAAAPVLLSVLFVAPAGPQEEHGPIFEEPESVVPAPDRPLDAKPSARPAWDDADDFAWATAEGTLTMCETAATPLLLVPGFGPLAYLGIGYACLVPAVLEVEWIETYHGGRDLAFWQAGLGLFAAKVIRDVTQLPAVVSLTTTSLTALVVGTLFAANQGTDVLPFDLPESYRPVALTGVLTSQAILLTVVDAARELAAYWAYRAALWGGSEVAEDTKARRRIQREEQIFPRHLGPIPRFWMMGAITAGARPQFSFWHVVPVVGRFVWAIDASNALLEKLTRFRKDSLDEDPDDMVLAAVAIYVLYGLDAAVSLATDGLMFLSAGVFVTGTALQLLAAQDIAAGGISAQLLAAFGVAGVVLATASYFFLLASELKRFIAPWLVPLLIGPVPPGYLEGPAFGRSSFTPSLHPQAME